MNITYLIGNGFDINIGMATRYTDFYKTYINEGPVNPELTPHGQNLIRELKKHLSDEGNYDYWSDLELALGDYVKTVKSVDDFDIIFDNISSSLVQYLTEKEKEFSFDNIDKNKLFDDLRFPEKHLPEGESSLLKVLKNENEDWSIDIITFNYTSSLEKIIDFQEFPITLGDHNNNFLAYGSTMRSISHIHGELTNGTILGVNDTSQINNEKLKEDIDFLSMFVKPTINRELRRLIDKTSFDLIESSDLTCLFGVSIGDTDKIWWEKVGEMLVRRSSYRIIIFEKGTPLSPSQIFKRPRIERRIRERFLSKTKIPKAKWDTIAERISIGYNTDMFNLKRSLS